MCAVCAMCAVCVEDTHLLHHFLHLPLVLALSADEHAGRITIERGGRVRVKEELRQKHLVVKGGYIGRGALEGVLGVRGMGRVHACRVQRMFSLHTSKTLTRSNMGVHVWLMTSIQILPLISSTLGW